MDSPVAESRLPVGSSASRILGRLTSARAIATRCCSPPESSLGRWPRRCVRRTRSSASRTRARAVGAIDLGQSKREFDVFFQCHAGQEMKRLKDHADRL